MLDNSNKKKEKMNGLVSRDLSLDHLTVMSSLNNIQKLSAVKKLQDLLQLPRSSAIYSTSTNSINKSNILPTIYEQPSSQSFYVPSHIPKNHIPISLGDGQIEWVPMTQFVTFITNTNTNTYNDSNNDNDNNISKIPHTPPPSSTSSSYLLYENKTTIPKNPSLSSQTDTHDINNNNTINPLATWKEMPGTSNILITGDSAGQLNATDIFVRNSDQTLCIPKVESRDLSTETLTSLQILTNEIATQYLSVLQFDIPNIEPGILIKKQIKAILNDTSPISPVTKMNSNNNIFPPPPPQPPPSPPSPSTPSSLQPVTCTSVPVDIICDSNSGSMYVTNLPCSNSLSIPTIDEPIVYSASLSSSSVSTLSDTPLILPNDTNQEIKSPHSKPLLSSLPSPHTIPIMGNTGFGAWCLNMYKTIGKFNTGMGYLNLNRLTKGSYNTSYGAGSGQYLINGSNNTLLGYNSGYQINHSNGNICIGCFSGPDVKSFDSQTQEHKRSSSITSASSSSSNSNVTEPTQYLNIHNAIIIGNHAKACKDNELVIGSHSYPINTTMNDIVPGNLPLLQPVLYLQVRINSILYNIPLYSSLDTTSLSTTLQIES